ncbi:hypothetical protein PSDVSF_25600 [Pseudodesulfovibrio sediminis]|uniref:Rhodanese domain-containing protein n=2 Tax=Pseudodesulfovibrio sediminis TaxID=2810563 RepID=A0ABN6ESH7_9BACT|nr:hypothetical protein PSDVSF_25600 [Pseudodesulfovibrio sediminis]
MLRHLFSSAWMLLALCLCIVLPAHAGDKEVWWSAALDEANRDGYRLIDDAAMLVLVQSGTKAVILDARADYEFEAGHIPGASNLEFDLGDRIELPSAKRAALKKLIGPDKKRTLVIYCRSFR